MCFLFLPRLLLTLILELLVRCSTRRTKSQSFLSGWRQPLHALHPKSPELCMYSFIIFGLLIAYNHPHTGNGPLPFVVLNPPTRYVIGRHSDVISLTNSKSECMAAYQTFSELSKTELSVRMRIANFSSTRRSKIYPMNSPR